MGFFSSWTFLIVMGVLLAALLIGGPLLIVLVIYLVSRSGKRPDRRDNESERD